MKKTMHLKLFIFIHISSSLLLFPVNGGPSSPAPLMPLPLVISASDLLLKSASYPAEYSNSVNHNISLLPSGNPLLNKICATTDYPVDCVVSIAPFQTGETYPVSVLKMEMQALRRGYQNASSIAQKINYDPFTSATVKDCLEVCLDMYQSGIYELDDALNAISEYDVPKLKSVLSATIADINTCEEAFLETPGVDSPLKEVDGNLAKIASNNLAIVNALFQIQ